MELCLVSTLLLPGDLRGRQKTKADRAFCLGAVWHPLPLALKPMRLPLIWSLLPSLLPLSLCSLCLSHMASSVLLCTQAWPGLRAFALSVPFAWSVLSETPCGFLCYHLCVCSMSPSWKDLP